MTATYIIALIFAFILADSVVKAVRDVTLAKRQHDKPCPNCGDNDKEKSE